LNLAGINLVGIAKGRKQEESLKDRFFKPFTPVPIILSPNSQSLHTLQNIRDEAHRFAITYHQKLRKKKALHSILDDIPGIGPRRKQILINSFGSLKNLKNAGEDEIRSVKGFNEKTAQNVYRFLHSDTREEL
jgi:excinuclease ABC subunit C